MNVRNGLAAVGAIGVLVLASGCDGVQTNPLAAALPAVFPATAFECSDSSGSNSTPGEIVDATLAMAKKTITAVQRAASDAPEASSRAQQMNEQFGEMLKSMPGDLLDGGDVQDMLDSDKLRQMALESVYRDVPAGGDAAFAEVACGVPAASLLDDVPKFSLGRYGIDEQLRRTAVGTPHYIRSVGRKICSAAEALGDDGRQFLEDAFLDDSDYKSIKRDPAGFIDEFIDMLDETEENAVENGTADLFGGAAMLKWDIGKARELYEGFRRDPQQLVEIADGEVEVARAAITYQCPDLRANS